MDGQVTGSDAVNVLLVEDSRTYVRLVEMTLSRSAHPTFAVRSCATLESAIEAVSEDDIDVVLLALYLADERGLNTFRRMKAAAPETAVIVLTAADDQAMAVAALHEGAQDYLVKGTGDPDTLVRSVRYAIERQRLNNELRSLALMDELTGLYNRRGFTLLVSEHIMTAGRRDEPVGILYIDLDGFKEINDTLGHQEGDRALMEAARLLREVFRRADIIARMGGDEFCVLLTTGTKDVDTARERLEGALEGHALAGEYPWRLQMSVGTVRVEPDRPVSVESLLEDADRDMYEHKRARKAAGAPAGDPGGNG